MAKNKYKTLNKQKILNKPSRIVSSNEALKDVITINWNENDKVKNKTPIQVWNELSDNDKKEINEINEIISGNE